MVHFSYISEKRWLFMILSVALFLRIATVMSLNIQPVSDYAAYEHMAVSLLAGTGLVDGDGNFAFMSAGYPLFVLAPVFAVFGHNLVAAQLANALLGTVSAWLIYLIMIEVGAGKPGRLIGVVIFAVYLPSWIYAEYLAKENLMTPLMLGVVLLSLRCTYNPSVWTAISVGAILGLLAITGSSGLALTPITVIALMMSPLPVSRKLVRLGLVAIVAMLILSPWMMRNDQVIGAPVVNTNGGFNLYIGNNPAADGLFVSIADTPRGSTWHQLRNQGEVIANDTLKNEAIAWIKQNPLEFLVLSCKKGLLFWAPPTHEGKGPQSKAETLTRLAWLVQFILISVVAVAGIVYKRLRTKNSSLLWLSVLGYTAVHMIFYVIYRYREPIMPLLIVLAGLTVERVIQTNLPAAMSGRNKKNKPDI